MSSVPSQPKIYHITHWQNLTGIIESGAIWSDAERIRREVDCEIVGMSSIKRRRLESLPVKCYPGTKVGEYVPFYFCARSIMLYILHMRNHPELSYAGGQGPIVHLVADLHAAVSWSESSGRRWAFSSQNAGATYASFYNRLADLNQVNWSAVAATDFRDPVVKEGKQAEFLIYGSFPWELVETIGVRDEHVETQVGAIVSKTRHRPSVSIERAWYY